MASISATEYRLAVSELLGKMSKRPSMYFRTVGDLEPLFDGHALAYWSFGLESGVETFNRAFTRWLVERERLSGGASGWWYHFPKLAEDQGREAPALFFDYVAEFLAEWAPIPEPTLAESPVDSPKP